MNSPFGKKMFDKNPISALQQNAFNAARIAAIEKGADTFKVGDKTFQVKGEESGINMGSPYHKHGKLEKKLKKAEAGKIGAEQGDKDYELIATIKEDIEEAKAAHNNTRTEEDDTQAREDEDAARGSAVEMNGYTGGGMSKQDYAPTSDLYQNMFDKVESATKEYHDRRDGTGAYAPKEDKDDNTIDEQKPNK